MAWPYCMSSFFLFFFLALAAPDCPLRCTGEREPINVDLPTPLTFTNATQEVFDYLLARGANVDHHCRNGWGVVMGAVRWGELGATYRWTVECRVCSSSWRFNLIAPCIAL